MATRWNRLAVLVLFGLAIAVHAAAQEADLTEEQMKEFLLKADVIKSKHTSKGVTSPYRLTLSDGNITHDAAFKSVDESRSKMQFADGRVEVNFVDSYKYDLAAYELAKLLGLGHMMPVTVLRKWNGKTGALAWWLPVEMDEESRLRNKVQPPDPDAWNKQMYRMRIFTELVYDTDRNLGNVLIGKDWKLYMIDFTRAFRHYSDLRTPQNLRRCDKQLLEQLRTLKAEQLAEVTKGLLSKVEVSAVMKRRDKIVTLFEQLAQKSADVIY